MPLNTHPLTGTSYFLIFLLFPFVHVESQISLDIFTMDYAYLLNSFIPSFSYQIFREPICVTHQ